jgi:hypothetical protein
MKRSFILLVFALLFASDSFAQRDSTQEDAKRTTLTLAGIYGNNANYYGQTAEQKLPYVLTNASLRLKSGLYFSAGSYKLINAGGSAISELDLSAGFETDISKISMLHLDTAVQFLLRTRRFWVLQMKIRSALH